MVDVERTIQCQIIFASAEESYLIGAKHVFQIVLGEASTIAEVLQYDIIFYEGLSSRKYLLGLLGCAVIVMY